MKSADVRSQSDDQLRENLNRLQREAFNLRFQKASGQLESTARMREVRRDIARHLTIIGERRRAQAAG
ncbi:MAG TPA: 50S ribosomal protein L29 [Alphaproteobacteria bacterium]|nr:50S ribosomal protein L29 [Alphaproteobacteria bacterium]